MANQVVGTGSVEIIFDYEKNLKNMLSSIQKEWNKVDVSKRLDEIDKSLDNLTKKTNDNTKATNDNAKAQRSKKDIAEILKNQELMLEKAMKSSNGTQKEYISTLQQQVKNGQELSNWQKEGIRLLKEEDKNQRNGALGYGLASYGLQQMIEKTLQIQKQNDLIDKNIVTGKQIGRAHV